MKNLIPYIVFEELNELRVLGTPFRISQRGSMWDEIARETISIDKGKIIEHGDYDKVVANKQI